MKKLILLISCVGVLFSSDMHDIQNGEQLYKDTCISCHGVDGKADTDMKLIVKPRDLTLTLLTEEQTYNIIKDGARYWGAKADLMPAFKYVFNESQLRDLSHYIVNKFNPDVKKRIETQYNASEKEPVGQAKKMAKWGKKIFNRNCKFCHGETGKGDGVATTSPVDTIFPYDLTKTLLNKKQMFLYIKHGGKHFGTDKDDMPSWKKKYNDFKIHSITKYVEEVIKKDSGK